MHSPGLSLFIHVFHESKKSNLVEESILTLFLFRLLSTSYTAWHTYSWLWQYGSRNQTYRSSYIYSSRRILIYTLLLYGGPC